MPGFGKESALEVSPIHQESMADRSDRFRSPSQPLTMGSDDDDDDPPKLPHDVAVEILKRLPVESLLRFRCVCRSWRSTIDDPSFVALHMNHSALDASNRHLVFLDRGDHLRNLCSLLSGESLARPSLSQIEIPFAAPPNFYYIVGSCNGLICVADAYRGRSMHLWNIFTRKHKAIPESKFLPVEKFHTSMGFGFCARSNDYKIVRLCYPYNHPLFAREIKSRVDIYSLSTDSWRSLECEVPTSCDDHPAFFNGNLHWFVLKHGDPLEEGDSGSIVLFDVAREMFDEMAPPEKLLHAGSVSEDVCVSVLNDLLAAFITHENAFGTPELHVVCSVWVMIDYGMPKSWTKLYTVTTSEPVAGFDGFTWNDELLMQTYDGERFSWNLITGQLTNLPLLKSCDLVTVTESLVSLKI